MQVQIDPIFVITTYSHFFKVNRITPRGRHLLDHFQSLYVQKAFRPNSTNPYLPLKAPNDKVYGFATGNLSEYRFHIGQFAHFKQFLLERGYNDAFYFVDQSGSAKPKSISAEIKKGWELRDKQPEVVDFLLTPMTDDLNSRLVTLEMGSGKTIIALWAVCQRRHRVAIIILPSYLEKWENDIRGTTTVEKKDVMVVRGGDYLRGLIDLGKTGKYDSDFVLISMRTWSLFIEAYVEDPVACVDQYGCTPEEVYDLLGIGTVIIDEIHQHLHAVYRTFCFMNVDLAIGLSGTFLSADQFIDRMQKTMFPKEIRYKAEKMKQYIRAYGISYTIMPDSMRLVKTMERGSTTYSQSAFERSIIKNKKLMYSYLNLVAEVVENGFMDAYKPGYKCIIFVRSVKMCEEIKQFLSLKYPQLDIRKYTEEDPYENLLDPDIRVTTQISAGTAHDIPGLMTNITLDNINSQQANLQCLGRLREPKEGTARYFTVFSESIKKHVQYYLDRKELFKERVVTFREFKSNIAL